MSLRRPARLLAILLPALGACGSEAVPPPASEPPSETLSAVHNDEPSSTEPVGRLTEPLLEFEAPTAMSLARLGSGSWVTTSRETGLVSIHEADGDRVVSVGGSGDPGSGFHSLVAAWRMQGDSILVVDRLATPDEAYRLVVLTPGGEYARHWQLVSRDGRTPTPICLVGGKLVLAVETQPERRAATGRMREKLTATLVRLDGTEAARRRGFLGQELHASDGQPPRPVIYGQAGCWACGESRVWYGDSDRYAVLELDTLLKPVRSIDRAWDPVMVGFASAEVFAFGLRSGILAQDSALQDPPIIARTYPAFDRIVDMGPEGLWVGGYGTPGEATVPWSIFTEDGLWLADTHLPLHFLPRYLAGDTLAGITRARDGRIVAALWRFERRTPEKNQPQ